ncbi:MAG: restriction endonuclease subunit S [Bacteriodetes bacterium]|nr:restriction endonuclease subunit S [Bacteroidota bacterium]
MKLKKDKWDKVKLDKLVFNVSERVEPNDTSLDKYIGLEHLDSGKIKIGRHGSPSEVIGTKLKIYKGDIIFGKRRAYQRKAAVADFDAICSAHSMVLRANENHVVKDYLLAFIHSDLFMNRAVEISEGSLSPTIKWKTLANQFFPLPPLEEQKQIAALFQSIETAIEQVDVQEKNLKALQKSLVNGLYNKHPEFGNLLNSNNCKAATFGEIAECDKNYPEHKDEVERFVGLENIEPDNFQLQGFGLVANGTTFTKRFVKGDVLFGKRRPYLKKVAIADYDGICSGDILVIRAKANTMLQGLLPYYISADGFIQHAISTSAGSLSPRTKWKDLANLEVSIPDLKTQEKILAVLQQLDNTVKHLKQQKTTLKLLKQKLLNEILG